MYFFHIWLQMTYVVFNNPLIGLRDNLIYKKKSCSFSVTA